MMPPPDATWVTLALVLGWAFAWYEIGFAWGYVITAFLLVILCLVVYMERIANRLYQVAEAVQGTRAPREVVLG